MRGSRDESKSPKTRVLWRILWRSLHGISVVAFVLPFATVKGCQSEEVEDYTGVELIAEGGGMLLGVIVIAAALFALTFAREHRSAARRGLREACVAFWSLWALGWLSLGTGGQFMFDNVDHRYGFHLCAACWGASSLLAIGLAYYRIPATQRELATLPRGSPAPRVVGLLLALGLLALPLVLPDNGPMEDRLRGVLGIAFSLLIFGPLYYYTVAVWRLSRKGAGTILSG